MNLQRLLFIGCIICMLFSLTACGQKAAAPAAVAAEVSESIPLASGSELFTARDLAGECREAEPIFYENGAAEITSGGSFLLSGSFTGRLTVNAPGEKVQLILSGAELLSLDGAALEIVDADKVFLTLAEGTENRITANGSFPADGADAAVFSRADLTLNGSGELYVECSEAGGIASKDDLKLCGVTLSVTAGGHGIEGKNSIRISGGSYTVHAGVDALHSAHSENADKGYIAILGGSFDLQALSDGMDASGSIDISGGAFLLRCGDDGIHSDKALTVSGGCLEIFDSYEGMEAPLLTISGGEISVTARDDGLNASDGSGEPGFGGRGSFSDASLLISGGTLTVNAAGDGLDSNGALRITGGDILVHGPTNSGNGALDTGSVIEISGGRILAIGASGMAVGFDASSAQPSILHNFPQSFPAGTGIALTAADGTVLLSAVSEKSFNSVVVSCEELQLGETYTLSVGSESVTLTLESISVSNGGFGNFGGFGGSRQPGGFGGGRQPGGFDGQRPPEGGFGRDARGGSV